MLFNNKRGLNSLRETNHASSYKENCSLCPLHWVALSRMWMEKILLDWSIVLSVRSLKQALPPTALLSCTTSDVFTLQTLRYFFSCGRVRSEHCWCLQRNLTFQPTCYSFLFTSTLPQFKQCPFFHFPLYKKSNTRTAAFEYNFASFVTHACTQREKWAWDNSAGEASALPLHSSPNPLISTSFQCPDWVSLL